MAGQLTIDTLKASSGVLATQNGMTGVAKAWVSFSGASGTIRSSFNVSSVTRSGTGIYIINMTTAMPDINYSATASASNSSATQFAFCGMYTTSGAGNTSAPTTSSFYLTTVNSSFTNIDPVYANVTVNGN
jgi:hypothetical protein